jgi:hypothetical protein
MITNSTDGSVAAPIPVASGASGHCHRMIPCEPAPVLSASVAGVLPQPVPNDGGRDTGEEKRTHRTCNPFIHEALRLLEKHGYDPSKPTGRNCPVVIFAQKGRDVLRIAVIRSRKPVPDAKTLRRLFPAKVRRACAYAKPGEYKTMIWVNSPIIGWRYFWVDIGGVGRDWEFTQLMEE